MGEKLKNHKNLTVFKQHGFIYKGESGSQVYGYSIFSGKDNFWINPETKAWDCKNTGKAGGYKKFLKEVLEFSQANFKGEVVKVLANKKGLKRSTLIAHNIGYNPSTEQYIIPIYDANGSDIWDLRIYDIENNGLRGTAGCHGGLFGWETLDRAKTVWICEGEWDKLAMYEILNVLDLYGSTTVVSVPGAGTFKSDWPPLFKDKIVYVAYDKDDPKTVNGVVQPGAGPKGTLKVYKSLINIAADLKFVHWDKKVASGYDIRDLLNESIKHRKAYKIINNLLKTDIPLEEKFRGDIEPEISDEELLDGPVVPCEEVYAGFRKWLHLPSIEVIDIIFGTLIANRLPGDPLWMFIVAPSGAAKTELLMSLSEAPKIASTTTLTPHSLVSGANYAGGGDPSLIPRLNGKVLIIKDFTTILNMNESYRDEIFGIFRDAFDGKTEKTFGNGVHRSYKSKFGILSGVTPYIDLFMENQSSLGERFLRYKARISDNLKERMKYLERAQANTDAGVANEMKRSLMDLSTRVLRHNYTDKVFIPTAIKKKLLILAQWEAIMRSSVIRDNYSKEIKAAPFTELGTRLVNQFTKAIKGFTLFRNKKRASLEEYFLVRNIALDSISSDIILITKYLYVNNKDKFIEGGKIINVCKLPTETTKRKLENLTMIGILIKRKNGFKFEYSINEELYFLFEEGLIYE